MPETISLNGVNRTQLFDTVNALKANPELARCKFRARNKWIYGGHNLTRIANFYSAGEERQHVQPFTHEEDEPPMLLGEDQGANPVEYLLSALGGCLTTTLVYNAAARGIEIQEIESELEGDLDLRGFLGLSPEVRNGYQQIRVNFKIQSSASREQIEELIRVAQERSPVLDMLNHGVPVNVTIAASRLGVFS